MRKVAIYLRVSTDQQDAEVQLPALTGYAAEHGLEVVATFQDVISGAASRLPQREACIKAALAEKFGSILLFSSSRFGRSAAHSLPALW